DMGLHDRAPAPPRKPRSSASWAASVLTISARTRSLPSHGLYDHVYYQEQQRKAHHANARKPKPYANTPHQLRPADDPRSKASGEQGCSDSENDLFGLHRGNEASNKSGPLRTPAIIAASSE